MNFSVEVSGINQVLKALNDLQRNRLPAALNRALNTSARQAKRAALKEARKTYTLSTDRLNKAVTLTAAKKDRPVAVITASGKPPGLQHYKAREVRSMGGVLARQSVSKQGGLYAKRVRRGQRGVSVEVMKGRRKRIPGAFMARMPSGGVGVFRRVGKSRLPIKRLSGPSVPGMFRARLKKVVSDTFRERFPKNLDRELRGELYKAGAGR